MLLLEELLSLSYFQIDLSFLLLLFVHRFLLYLVFYKSNYFSIFYFNKVFAFIFSTSVPITTFCGTAFTSCKVSILSKPFSVTLKNNSFLLSPYLGQQGYYFDTISSGPVLHGILLLHHHIQTAFHSLAPQISLKFLALPLLHAFCVPILII